MTPLTGHTKAPVKPACKGQPERGESPPGAAFKEVWSSGPIGLPPSAVRARDRRLQPGGQRGVRAWPEKPKGNGRKRKYLKGGWGNGNGQPWLAPCLPSCTLYAMPMQLLLRKSAMIGLH